MKVAISTEGNIVSGHFGHCPSFTLFDIESNKVTNKQTIDNPGHQPGFLPQFLREKGVNCIIAGGMGGRAQQLFTEVGIKIIIGVTGEIDTVIDQLLEGTLKGGESSCTHGEGETCGGGQSQCDH